jgi:hypothetical protein
VTFVDHGGFLASLGVHVHSVSELERTFKFDFYRFLASLKRTENQTGKQMVLNTFASTALYHTKVEAL